MIIDNKTYSLVKIFKAIVASFDSENFISIITNDMDVAHCDKAYAENLSDELLYHPILVTSDANPLLIDGSHRVLRIRLMGYNGMLAYRVSNQILNNALILPGLP